MSGLSYGPIWTSGIHTDVPERKAETMPCAIGQSDSFDDHDEPGFEEDDRCPECGELIEDCGCADYAEPYDVQGLDYQDDPTGT